MWKLILGFVAFAAIAMYVLAKAGGDIDLGGEKHGVETTHTEPAKPAAAANAAPATAPAPAAPAPAAK
jgi:hypothetical protein